MKRRVKIHVKNNKQKFKIDAHLANVTAIIK